MSRQQQQQKWDISGPKSKRWWCNVPSSAPVLEKQAKNELIKPDLSGFYMK